MGWVKKLGKPVSHGCVRISPKNAAALYSLVAKNGIKNTQVVLTGFTRKGRQFSTFSTNQGGDLCAR